MRAVRQLITRIDDDLHRRLKERAASEGRSMNAVVTGILEEAVPRLSERERYREKLRREGRLYEPPVPKGPVLSLDEVIELGRGSGTAVSDALREDRKKR
jgi:plasmid stability protein